MSKNTTQAIAYFLLTALINWYLYGWNHSEDQLVPAVNTFWLGAINFMIMAYILFSK